MDQDAPGCCCCCCCLPSLPFPAVEVVVVLVEVVSGDGDGGSQSGGCRASGCCVWRGKEGLRLDSEEISKLRSKRSGDL